MVVVVAAIPEAVVNLEVPALALVVIVALAPLIEVLVVVSPKIEVKEVALVVALPVPLVQECPTALKEEANVVLINQRLPAVALPPIRVMALCQLKSHPSPEIEANVLIDVLLVTPEILEVPAKPVMALRVNPVLAMVRKEKDNF